MAKKWPIEKLCKDEKVKNLISPISGAALVDTRTPILDI